MPSPAVHDRPAARRGRAVADVGEFALIDRLARVLRAAGADGRGRADVAVGIGDDVAVVAVEAGERLLATVDAQVEGVHFRRDLLAAADVGHRALAAGASDVAAMGGRPRQALVSLVVRPDVAVDWLERLYRGLGAAAARWGIAVVGGNVARSDGPVVVDVTVLGTARPDAVIGRSGARPGDRIVVVGPLGAAAAGLRLALDPTAAAALGGRDRAALLGAWRRPSPPLAAGPAAAAAGGVTAMIDVSDGFAADLGHICDASGVGVRVALDRLPIPPAVRRAAAHLAAADGAAGPDGDPWPGDVALALGGGEDYALCLTCDPAAAAAVVAAVRRAGARAVDVGDVRLAAEGRRAVDADGRSRPLGEFGWRHV